MIELGLSLGSVGGLINVQKSFVHRFTIKKVLITTTSFYTSENRAVVGS